jgi:serine/threonine protein kinase
VTLSTQPRRSNYRILGLVGHGQFGRVYCAVHRKTGRLAAIKRLNRYGLPTHAFLRELRCLLSLDHAHIVACHALEHTAEGRQLVLEYCEGGTLRSLMGSASKISYAEILAIVTDILAGLAHAHQKSIIHCDIKPENILLKVQERRWAAKISDFGIAQLVQEFTVSSASGHTGSPAYMSPECFYQQYSPASDVYSVGVLLFELLVGHRPFSGTPADLMAAHLNQPVPIPTTLVEPLKTIVLKALEKLPARRYPSATAMLAALQALGPTSPLVSLGRGDSNPSALIPDQAYRGQPIGDFPEPIHRLLSASMALPSLVSDTPDTLVGTVTAGMTIDGMDRETGQPWVIGISKQHLYLRSYDWAADQPCLRIPSPPGSTDQICALTIVPQGVCLMTAKTLYRMNASWHAEPSPWQPICHWSNETGIVVAPNGRWFAGVTPQTTDWRFTVGRLRHRDTGVDADSKLWVETTFAVPSGMTLEQVLVTDNRHLVVVLKTPDQSTQIKILARRGLVMGQIDLGLSLYRFIPTENPYRFLALDAAHPKSALIVDLKPFRLIRLPLDIEPVFLSLTSWGYLFLDRDGRLLILDRDTCPIGCVEGPSNPVAMIPAKNHEILIATGDTTGQAALYAINLQNFELDILF